MNAALRSLGHYRSPVGGAPAPHPIGPGSILFELITDGSVYEPASDVLRSTGWVFAHQPGQSTVWRSEPDGRYECMTAAFDLGHVPRPEEWPRCFFWGNAEDAVSFAYEMLHAFHHTSVERGVLGDLVWSQFCFRLDCFRRQEGRTEIPPRLSAILAHMDQHFSEQVSVEDLAERIGLSASHLHARFREFVGITPHQYLIRRRMQAARHLLATSVDPIKTIAANVGYANTESFCRAFKQHVHTTAATYRRTYMIYR